MTTLTLRFFNRAGSEISAYWWHRQQAAGDRYGLVKRSPIKGGVVSTAWIGVAAEWEAPPLIFCTTANVEGKKPVTIFSDSEDKAILMHQMALHDAK